MDKQIRGLVTDESFSPDAVRASTGLSPYEQEQRQQQSGAASITGYQVAAKIVWVIAAIVMAYYANIGYENFALAQSAPQQAAAAGWGCFQLMVPYVLARALSEALTIWSMDRATGHRLRGPLRRCV